MPESPKVIIVEDDIECGKLLEYVMEEFGIKYQGFVSETPERDFLSAVRNFHDKFILIIDYTAMAETWQALHKNSIAENMKANFSQEEEEGLYHFQKMIKNKMIHVVLASAGWKNETFNSCARLTEENGKIFKKPYSICNLVEHIENVISGKELFANNKSIV